MASNAAKRQFEELTESAAKRLHSNVIIKDATIIREAKTGVNPADEDGLAKCFHRIRANLYLSLAPCYNEDPISGIKQQHLDQMLMTYSSTLQGVVISYFRVKLSEENMGEDIETGEPIVIGKLSTDTPFSFLWVSVDFLVWAPKVGDVVDGWVYMQSQSHIGLLVHDTFNATIKKYNIPAGWTFVPNQADDTAVEGGSGNEGAATAGEHRFGKSLGQWQDENGVPIEGKLRFTVRALHPAGQVLSVEGTLQDPQSERDIQPITPKKHLKFGDEDEDEADEGAEGALQKIDAEAEADAEAAVEGEDEEDDDDDEDDDSDDSDDSEDSSDDDSSEDSGENTSTSSSDSA